MKIAPSQQTNIKLLRKASSSRDPVILQKLLSTNPPCKNDLETPSSDGKNALHMACWMGCIDNISLLLSHGCDINAISTGKHNYGKTPIFYAITKGREDVVQFLLNEASVSGQNAGDRVNVRIVNNKGQSVYSLAYSHDFGTDILECIRNREAEDGIHSIEEQDGVATENGIDGWLDYSISHSDGCVYGDLDLRFLHRPLSAEDVVKDGIVVNPTSKESRKGNFTKNNPTMNRCNSPDKIHAKEKKSGKERELMKSLSSDQQVKLEQLWSAVAKSLQQSNSWDLFSSLLTIVQFWEESDICLPWIHNAAFRLDFLIQYNDVQMELHQANESSKSLLPEAIIFCGSGDRHVALVKRILTRTNTVKDTSLQNNNQTQRDSESLHMMQQEQFALFWNDIEMALDNHNPHEIYLSLIKPIILSDGRSKSNWPQDYGNKLHSILESKSVLPISDSINQVLQLCETSSSRYASLLKRLLNRQIEEIPMDNTDTMSPMSKLTSPVKKHKHQLPDEYKHFIKSLQKEAENSCSIDDLPSWNVLMHPYLTSKAEQNHLSLSRAPLFVDSSFDLQQLESKLRKVTSTSNSSHDDYHSIQFTHIIAFDSEFYTSDSGDTELATIQFSLMEEGLPSAWVVDLLPTRDEGYHSITCDFLRWLFFESSSNIIGFSPRHDMHLLSLHLGEDVPKVSSSNIWDMQLLAAHKMAKDIGSSKNSMASMPGLKSCCSYFGSPPWTLSKDEQCSNWGQRPLSADQLEYAGLDAAVLFVLLSELVTRG